MHDLSPVSFMNGPLQAPPSDPAAALLGTLQRLVEDTASLIELAARQLGLDDASARLAGETSTLQAGEHTIGILPVARGDDDALSLVLSVQTSIPVLPTGQVGDAVTVLQHAPGALHAFSASLGATPDGCWVVYRTVRASPDNGAALALLLVETVRLADFVLQGGPQRSH
ncbi:hypothetical protein ACPOLB_24915 [Rubrivivax sp. RP6-9]|uniref:hypothetical protein n=1 Tax=Rubrivivax sp. RP6-9 TaxID=3415750 RepID=UPI003CC5516A